MSAVSTTIEQVRHEVLKALHDHVKGSRSHASGRDYLQPGEIAELLSTNIPEPLLARVLRMMLDAGDLELFRDIWVFRLSDEGFRKAESLAVASGPDDRSPNDVHQDTSMPSAADIQQVSAPVPRAIDVGHVDWGKCGAIAGIFAIPLTIILWWFA